MEDVTMPLAVDAVNADVAPANAPEDTASDPLRGTPPTRRDILPAVAVATVVTVMAWVWRSPMVPTDPFHYVVQTLEFPSDDWVALGLSRYGIFLANLLPAYLFKNAEATYYFWPLVSTALLAAMVYLHRTPLLGGRRGARRGRRAVLQHPGAVQRARASTPT